ncbi:hypothetical protein FCV25MIE_05297 [Fagus crenata]
MRRAVAGLVVEREKLKTQTRRAVAGLVDSTRIRPLNTALDYHRPIRELASMVKPKRARGSKREKKRKSQATKARRKTIRERVMVLGLGLGLEWSRVDSWQRQLRWGEREIW